MAKEVSLIWTITGCGTESRNLHELYMMLTGPRKMEYQKAVPGALKGKTIQ